MKDIGGIDPQLKSIAKKIPYNRLMIKHEAFGRRCLPPDFAEGKRPEFTGGYL